MCGVAGLINFKNDYIETIKKSLYHRGPDAQTHYQYKNLSLIHTRLSIQDVKHGDQPFIIGNHVIVFNGEIYNHLSLRRKVKRHQFKTQSDTETLLALYIEYGSKALEMCDGMFAFVIFNKENNSITLGRDRIGKKPLYIHKNKNKIFIASELNVFLQVLPDLSINEQAIESYLRCGFFYSGITPYKNTQEILPGHVYQIDIHSMVIKKQCYFDIAKQYNTKISINHNEAVEELDSLLRKSIINRLISSDLKVGAFLSGGVDSSLITAIASEYTDNLKTFTVKFDKGIDESYLARKTAQLLSTQHHELGIAMDLKNDVENILTSYGEPFMDSSAIPSYYVSREAKKHLTVVLNGDGADELFAGYRRYVPSYNNWHSYAKKIHLVRKILPIPKDKQTYYNYFYRLLMMSNKEGLDYYLSSTTDIFEDFYRFNTNNTVLLEIESLIKRINNQNISNLSKSLIMDSKLILPSDLLKKMDIATMANSVEARSPFLSKYLLEWVPKLPDREKISGINTKYILRELLKKYSLNYLALEPKKGFEVPLNFWVNNDLKENIYDRVGNNSYATQFIDTAFVNKLLSNKEYFPQEKRAKMLWSLYALEVWHSNYLHCAKNIKTDVPILSSTRVNILLLTTGLGLGGAERVVLDICKNINKNKFKPMVISISSQDEMLDDFINSKIDAEVLNHKKTITNFIVSIRHIYKKVKINDIKIIHVHMFHALLISSVIKFIRPSVKIIFTPHNSFKAMKIRRWLLWMLKPWRDLDTVFSNGALSYFHKLNNKIIPNAINIYEYNPNPNPNSLFTFIIIGRLEKMKNHQFLISVVSRLKQYNFQLLIVGSGILEKSLKIQVKSLNLDDRIKFLGARRDVPDLLEKSDCLLLPSLWEAFPITLLEAGACQVPVITTPVGSIPTLIDNDTGYLVDLDQFQNTMVHVMTNYAQAKKKSLALFEKVSKDYNIKDIVHNYESAYQGVL